MKFSSSTVAVLATSASILLLLPKGVSADCSGMGVDGTCFDLGNFLNNVVVDGLNSGVASSGDATLVDMYEHFLEPLVETAISVATYDLSFSFCFGDFDGSQFASNEILDNLCGGIPVIDDKNYGVMSAEFGITQTMQGFLIPYLWSSPPAETVTPNFCVALRIPNNSCNKATFALSFNPDTIQVINEVAPGTSPFEVLVKIATVAADAGLESATLGVSMGGGLEIPVKLYYDEGFHDETFPAHFYLGMQGALDLDFLPSSFAEVVAFEGEYHRGWNFGPTISQVESLFNDITSLDTSDLPGLLVDFLEMAVSIPEVIVASSTLSLDFEDATKGLLGKFELVGAEVHALKVATGNFRNFDPGFYLYTEVSTGVFETIVDSFCESLDGILKALGVQKCSDMVGNASGKIGIMIKSSRIEVHFSVPGLKLQCRAKRLGSSNPKMDCKVNNAFFNAIEDAAGYVINKIENWGEDAIEEVSEISKETIKQLKKFGKETGVAIKTSSKAAKNLWKAIDQFFSNGLGNNSNRKDLAFGFVSPKKCSGSSLVTLWNSYQPDGQDYYQNYFNELGNDDSRAACFTSCYLYFTENHPNRVANEDTSSCCGYKKYQGGDTARCQVGLNGRETAGDTDNSATIHFIRDYHDLANRKDAGETCSNHGECFTGFCDGVCKEECFLDNKCFPSAYTRCYGVDDACIDVEGYHHKCDKATDTCKIARYQRCNTIEPGDYAIKQNGRWWRMDRANEGANVQTESSITYSDTPYKFTITQTTKTVDDVTFPVLNFWNVNRQRYVAWDEPTGGEKRIDGDTWNGRADIMVQGDCTNFIIFMNDVGGTPRWLYDGDGTKVRWSYTAPHAYYMSSSSQRSKYTVQFYDYDASIYDKQHGNNLYDGSIYLTTPAPTQPDPYAFTDAPTVSPAPTAEPTTSPTRVGLCRDMADLKGTGVYYIRSLDTGNYWRMRHATGDRGLHAQTSTGSISTRDQYFWKVVKEDGVYKLHNVRRDRTAGAKYSENVVAGEGMRLENFEAWSEDPDCTHYKILFGTNRYAVESLTDGTIEYTNDEASATLVTLERTTELQPDTVESCTTCSFQQVMMGCAEQCSDIANPDLGKSLCNDMAELTTGEYHIKLASTAGYLYMESNSNNRIIKTSSTTDGTDNFIFDLQHVDGTIRLENKGRSRNMGARTGNTEIKGEGNREVDVSGFSTDDNCDEYLLVFGHTKFMHYDANNNMMKWTEDEDLASKFIFETVA